MLKNIKESIKTKHIVGTLLIFMSLLILMSIIWGNRTFSVRTLSQIIFHMKVPMEGTDNEIYLNWFIWCVPASLIGSILIYVTIFNIHKIFRKNEALRNNIQKVINKFFTLFGVLCLVASLIFTLINFDVYGYFNNVLQKTDLYEKYYVNPKTAKISFNNGKRNLIHIYLESIETTYTSIKNGGAYDKGYMPELEQLGLNNINFSSNDKLGGSQTVVGTQWTIAAQVAQSAGIPLSLPIEGNSYNGSSKFLPGAYTIGQVLQEQGYAQEILMGSDSNFAGTSNFYTQHGNYAIEDYNKVKKEGRIDKDYHVFWGFEDEKLFQFAKEDALKLASQGKPFNLEMITIDSHTPDGYLSNDAPRKYDNQYENVIAFQSKQVSEFVKWAKQQDFYKNTTIIITGDHNSMASKFFEGLDSSYIRTPYNVIINAPIVPIQSKNRLFTTMDWYPTILASIGATIEGERLGLGTNLFSNKPTLLEELGFDYLNGEVQKTSKFYNKTLIGIE